DERERKGEASPDHSNCELPPPELQIAQGDRPHAEVLIRSRDDSPSKHPAPPHSESRHTALPEWRRPGFAGERPGPPPEDGVGIQGASSRGDKEAYAGAGGPGSEWAHTRILVRRPQAHRQAHPVPTPPICDRHARGASQRSWW